MIAAKFADGLKQENFRVLEDKVEQKLSVFKREDVPVSMGLVIDNSGSMRDKRPRVNEAAITLVQASNPQDEAFVVNFNDDYYLDLDKDFSSSVPELKEALERIDSRGSTALYDAIIGSIDHLKKAHKDKRVLLVVTDGEDNTSRNSLEKAVREIQKTDTVIYTLVCSARKKGSPRPKPKKPSKKSLTPPVASPISRKRRRRPQHLRPGRSRHPQSIHPRLLPDQHPPRRHLPRRSCRAHSAPRPRQISSPHPHGYYAPTGQSASAATGH